MAITAGQSKILYNDTVNSTDGIKNKYDAFNTFLSRFGGSIQQLILPEDPSTAKATDINDLNDKIIEI